MLILNNLLLHFVPSLTVCGGRARAPRSRPLDRAPCRPLPSTPQSPPPRRVPSTAGYESIPPLQTMGGELDMETRCQRDSTRLTGSPGRKIFKKYFRGYGEWGGDGGIARSGGDPPWAVTWLLPRSAVIFDLPRVTGVQAGLCSASSVRLPSKVSLKVRE
jgi:hypothetical protein